MLRPLPLDLLWFVLPLAVGAGVFVAGRSLRRWPMSLRVGLVTLAVAVVGAGGLSLARLLPFEVEAWLAPLGGATVLLGWVALFLIGIVWDVPGRSMSSAFLVAIALLAGCLVLIESAGPLWWRFGHPDMWQRTPDGQGNLQQSSGATCAPAAAVMLLHRLGIPSSEGEMAYLAGTSLFGTDTFAMARALREKAGPLGWRVRVARLSSAEAAAHVPFLAYIQKPAGHALLIERIRPDHVELVDPADGQPWAITRSKFESIWNGTMLYLEREN
jgi:hypothetical protein